MSVGPGSSCQVDSNSWFGTARWGRRQKGPDCPPLKRTGSWRVLVMLAKRGHLCSNFGIWIWTKIIRIFFFLFFCCWKKSFMSELKWKSARTPQLRSYNFQNPCSPSSPGVVVSEILTKRLFVYLTAHTWYLSGHNHSHKCSHTSRQRPQHLERSKGC